jgi:hypothetical protein
MVLSVNTRLPLLIPEEVVISPCDSDTGIDAPTARPIHRRDAKSAKIFFAFR